MNYLIKKFVTFMGESRQSTGRKISAESGMTLLEIIVVIVIIGVIMTFLVGNIFNSGNKAKAELNRSVMTKTKGYIDLFRLQYNSLPQSLDELSKCSERTGQGCTPIASADSLKDVWGNTFLYSLDEGGRRYTLKTLGADGKAGGEGPDYDTSIQGP